MLVFVCYPKCTTCKKAQALLDGFGAEYEVRDIKTDNPTYEELTAWLKLSKLPVSKFFNTSGLQYRSLNLKDRLKTMTEEECLKLLATDGMLVKRPMLVDQHRALIGFKKDEWEAVFTTNVSDAVMGDRFDSVNRRIIKTMNKHMGTAHRIMPYDMNNPSDLQHALTMAVAAYRDYQHYERTLYKLDEDFDESLEDYDTMSWFNLTLSPEKSDPLAIECLDALSVAAHTLGKMTARAKDHFDKILKIILSSSPETQSKVLGRAYNIKPGDLDKRVADLFDLLDETEYQYKIPENFETLLKLMSEEWL